MPLDSSFSTRIATREDAKAVRMLLSVPLETFEYLLVAESGDPAPNCGSRGIDQK